MKAFTLTSSIILAAMLSSCSILRTYRGDIQQGNNLTAAKISSIRVGMTKDQVVAKLGQPVLTQPLANDQVTYVYRFQPGYGKAIQKTLRITYSHNRVRAIQQS